MKNKSRANPDARYLRMKPRLICAMLANPSIDAAASAVGIARQTASQYVAREDFQESYKEAQARVFDAALHRLMALSCKATDTLEKALESKSPQARIRAACAILAGAETACRTLVHAHQIQELQKQLAELQTRPRAAPLPSPVEPIDDDAEQFLVPAPEAADMPAPNGERFNGDYRNPFDLLMLPECEPLAFPDTNGNG